MRRPTPLCRLRPTAGQSGAGGLATGGAIFVTVWVQLAGSGVRYLADVARAGHRGAPQGGGAAGTGGPAGTGSPDGKAGKDGQDGAEGKAGKLGIASHGCGTGGQERQEEVAGLKPVLDGTRSCEG